VVLGIVVCFLAKDFNRLSCWETVFQCTNDFEIVTGYIMQIIGGGITGVADIRIKTESSSSYEPDIRDHSRWAILYRRWKSKRYRVFSRDRGEYMPLLLESSIMWTIIYPNGKRLTWYISQKNYCCIYRKQIDRVAISQYGEDKRRSRNYTPPNHSDHKRVAQLL